MKAFTPKRLTPGSALNAVILAAIGFVTVYPFIYILSTSISLPSELVKRNVFLLPLGFDLSTYGKVFADIRIVTGFQNSILYTVVGTACSVLVTMMMAYPLAVQNDFRRYSKGIMKLVLFSMYFSGGMIPTYILVSNLGLIDSLWSMVIPSLVGSFNLILARTFIRELPGDLYEAAVIDGANEIYIFFNIVLPLSKPIIAVITLYYAVGIWNSFFTPLLYLNSPEKYPLQIYLREMVISMQLHDYQSQASFDKGVVFASEAVKSCTLVVSTIPILVFYPFLQKYFAKGVMIGAIKG